MAGSKFTKPTAPSNCLECGAPIEQVVGGGRVRRYCCQRCRDKAKYKEKKKKSEHQKTCAQCGEAFWTWQAENTFCSNSCAATFSQNKLESKTCMVCGCTFQGKNQQLYCSAKCKKEHHNQNPKYDYTCQECGKRFKSTKSAGRKFCSQECYQNSLRIWGTAECIVCGQIFRTTGSNVTNLYCSKACSGKHRVLARKRSCLVCGAEYTWQDNEYCSDRFCSLECEAAPKPAQVFDKICERCGEAFAASWPTAKYCSSDCRNQSYNEIRRLKYEGAPKKEIVCQCCGSAFMSSNPKRLVCDNSKCRTSAYKQGRKDQRRRRRARMRSVKTDVFTSVEIFERDGWRCGICGEKVNKGIEYPHPKSASLDHIVPLAEGGEHSKANCQLAHFSCNARKGAHTVRGGEQLRLFG